MVFTVEPGLYVPADAEDVPAAFRGIGVRIEDDVLVTETGYEVLSAAAPKQVAEIEALRAGAD
jgi:Xaa-Pro aminopeptidase